MQFDQEKVERLVTSACAAYESAAAQFADAARALVARGDHAGASAQERASYSKVEPVAASLSAALEKEAPGDPGELVQAMQNARRIN